MLLVCAYVLTQGQSDNNLWRQSPTSFLCRVLGTSAASDKSTSRMLNLRQGTEVIVDFSKNADGMPLFGDMYVDNAWDKYGLTLSAMGGLGTALRLFDTSNPRGPDGKGGDSDLGSPNNGCYPLGPSVGGGGEPGMPGENCDYQGNVLIIQENNNNPDIPDDNKGGGTITFNFSQSTQFVAEIGLMDIDKLNSKIIFIYEGEVGLAQKTIDSYSCIRRQFGADATYRHCKCEAIVGEFERFWCGDIH